MGDVTLDKVANGTTVRSPHFDWDKAGVDRASMLAAIIRLEPGRPVLKRRKAFDVDNEILAVAALQGYEDAVAKGEMVTLPSITTRSDLIMAVDTRAAWMSRVSFRLKLEL